MIELTVGATYLIGPSNEEHTYTGKRAVPIIEGDRAAYEFAQKNGARTSFTWALISDVKQIGTGVPNPQMIQGRGYLINSAIEGIYLGRWASNGANLWYEFSHYYTRPYPSTDHTKITWVRDTNVHVIGGF